MRVLVLGHGKTGKLVADVATERGHSVHVLDAKENPGAMALTHPFVAGFGRGDRLHVARGRGAEYACVSGDRGEDGDWDDGLV